MNDQIVIAAKEAFKYRLTKGSVSQHTRNANLINKHWRKLAVEIDPENIQYEVPISPEFDQRIDVLDKSEMCAYEFKVSGNNATYEFYKDVVKILLWNEHQIEKIKTMVFITEEVKGKKHLDTPLPIAYIKYLRNQNININLVYI